MTRQVTRQEFETKAIRDAERKARVPVGWWGTWRDATNGTARVRLSEHGRAWVLSVDGKIVSRHDSRAFAFAKARKL